MGDGFLKKTVDIIAKRAGFRCSNPECRCLTVGAKQRSDEFVIDGIAAHITAASPSFARYDSSLSPDKRKHPSNGIWLCPNCHKLTDTDIDRFPVKKLRKWKREAEDWTIHELGSPVNQRDQWLTSTLNNMGILDRDLSEGKNLESIISTLRKKAQRDQ